MTTAKKDKLDAFRSDDSWGMLRLIWNFVIHIAVGTFLFVLIAMVALGLALFVEWLASKHMPSLLLQTVTLLEYALFAADVMAFAVFLYTSLHKLLRALWQHLD